MIHANRPPPTYGESQSKLSNGDEEDIQSCCVEVSKVGSEIYSDFQSGIERVVKISDDVYSGRVDSGGRSNCCLGLVLWAVLSVGFFLFIFYVVQYDGRIARSPNDAIEVLSGQLSSPPCLNLIQGIRSAYYKNSGEYQCQAFPGGKNNIQCIETYTTLEFGCFSADFERLGACVDFDTGEAMCYNGPSGGVFVGIGLSASYGMTITCPNQLSSVSGAGLSVCLPTVSLMGANPWPGFCWETNINKNHHHRTAPKVSTDDTSYSRGGYSMEFGMAGLEFSFSLLSVTGGTMNVLQQGVVALGPAGVRGGGLGRAPYSLEWFLFWSYILVAVVILYRVTRRAPRILASLGCGGRATRSSATPRATVGSYNHSDSM